MNQHPDPTNATLVVAFENYNYVLCKNQRDITKVDCANFCIYSLLQWPVGRVVTCLPFVSGVVALRFKSQAGQIEHKGCQWLTTAATFL